jgi:protein subunit release factor A
MASGDAIECQSTYEYAVHRVVRVPHTEWVWTAESSGR